ncbi:hypothetical protein CEXT_578881 [Caerostris extrusa]|uniref:Uncharacterized protein n=1 Tax=Caerostris extrusa TaxID=172846 RepID=A0AAV4N861_CAEEX|nr:hypothetical protein CEXT_578881 [Caerostris extrusa]
MSFASAYFHQQRIRNFLHIIQTPKKKTTTFEVDTPEETWCLVLQRRFGNRSCWMGTPHLRQDFFCSTIVGKYIVESWSLCLDFQMCFERDLTLKNHKISPHCAHLANEFL